MEFVKIELTGFQSICDRLAELEKENEKLKQDLEEVEIHEEMLIADNEYLENQNKKLKREIQYLNSQTTITEGLGRQFAKELTQT